MQQARESMSKLHDIVMMFYHNQEHRQCGHHLHMKTVLVDRYCGMVGTTFCHSYVHI